MSVPSALRLRRSAVGRAGRSRCRHCVVQKNVLLLPRLLPVPCTCTRRAFDAKKPALRVDGRRSERARVSSDSGPDAPYPCFSFACASPAKVLWRAPEPEARSSPSPGVTRPSRPPSSALTLATWLSCWAETGTAKEKERAPSPLFCRVKEGEKVGCYCSW